MSHTLNPRRIRFVASQFTQLQGLYTAAYGVTFALYCVIGSLPRHDELDDVVKLVSYLVPITFQTWAIYAIPRFYARRFGSVGQKHMWARPHLRFAVWSAIGLWLLVGHHQGWDALWIAWIIYPLYIAFVAWPYRSHYLLVAAAAIYVAVNRTLIGRQVMQPPSVVEVLVVAGGIILVGLLDHLVLVRVLAPDSEGSEDPAYDQISG